VATHIAIGNINQYCVQSIFDPSVWGGGGGERADNNKIGAG
jgi:hypothetical protein